MKRELQLLREQMKKHSIDAYLIPTDDFHGSEYVGDYFKCRKYVSGFTGSAGILVVFQDEAGLFTDGRYFLQAARQLEGSGITLFKMGQPGVPTYQQWLYDKLEKRSTLAFDGRCIMTRDAEALESVFAGKSITFMNHIDLVGQIWADRPSMSCEPAWELPLKYAGVSRKEKLALIREKMAEHQANWYLIASLEDICWLLNVRGNDIESTPVVLSYFLMDQEGHHGVWYVQDGVVSAELKETLAKENITVKGYFDVYDDVEKLPAGQTLIYDACHVNITLSSKICPYVRKIDEENLTLRPKAVKNPVEVENMRKAHVKDGVAMVKFIYWLKQNVGKETITELSAAEKLHEFRAAQTNFVEDSFSPIIGYGPHGAIIHYSATPESNVELKPEGLLLTDTGGHYLEGTSDTTRTIVLGPVTQEEKDAFTLVLRSHIALARARFMKGCTGANLDGLARTPFWDKGLDYNHGTGHGVGYLLNVHEGPNEFRYKPRGDRGEACVLEEGMITTNEPGIYLEDKFGVRHENMLLCRKDLENGYGNFMVFEPLTMVPFDLEGVDASQMTSTEIEWLNAYHETVYQKLSGYLTAEEATWLKEATKAI